MSGGSRTGHARCVVLVCAVFAVVVCMHKRYSTLIVSSVQQLARPLALAANRVLDQCPVDAFLCGERVYGERVKETADFNALRSTYHSLMTVIDFKCPSTKRFGHAGDGGYEVCMWNAIKPNNGSCLVYSFGINNDFSFDDDLAKYGCEVHSFDPSMGKEDHLHAPNVHFHNLGLWGNDYVNSKGWKLARLSTIKKILGHEKRIIDVLKIDAEGAEWPFFRDTVFYNPGTYSSVRQLIMELHSPKAREQNMTWMDFAEINVYTKRLRVDLGFQLISSNYSYLNCCPDFAYISPPGVRLTCCHTVFFINSNLLARQA